MDNPQHAPQQEQRRAHPRYATSLAAELTIGEDTIACTANNLSMGGVGISLSHALAEGAQLLVNLFLVEEEIEDATTPSMNLQAQVVWISQTDGGDFQAGLRWLQLTPQHTQLLQHFFARLD